MKKEIKELDEQIINLINKRTTLFIDAIKERGNTTGIYSPKDIIDISEIIETSNKGPLSNKLFKKIYNEILSYSIQLVKPIKVAYLGPEGTFSHASLLDIFGSSVESVPQNSIASVFEEVESGRSQLGVVPVENSTEGSVNFTLDELTETNLRIVSERLLKISNCLLSNRQDLKEIQKI